MLTKFRMFVYFPLLVMKMFVVFEVKTIYFKDIIMAYMV